jgi:hypothetical protein
MDSGNTTGNLGRVRLVTWGGRLTTATGYRTRWARPSTEGSSTFTTLTPVALSPYFTTPNCRAGTFATAPTLPTDPSNLWAEDWNAFGGGGSLVLPLGAEWVFANTATGYKQISCRNVAGTDANGSSYGGTWEEV